MLRLAMMAMLLGSFLFLSGVGRGEEFNPYSGLAAIKRFAFVNGYFGTEGSAHDFDVTDRELKNFVILKLRHYLPDTPYVAVEGTKGNPASDGRLVCEVMSVSNDAKIEFAMHVRCIAGTYGLGAGAPIWDDATIALVGREKLRAMLDNSIDHLIENFAGEFYRAKAEQAGRKK